MRPYVEIALLQTTAPADDDFYDDLRQQGGSMGCDAILVTGAVADPRPPTTFAGRGPTATCVMWTEISNGPPGATSR